MFSTITQNPSARRVLGAAAAVAGAAVLTFGGSGLVAHADVGANYDRYATTRVDGGRATFDRVDGDFDVCDKAANGSRVYVTFSATEDHGRQYYDTTSGSACTNFSGTASNHAGVMYVCEEDSFLGWDDCSDGIATYWNM